MDSAPALEAAYSAGRPFDAVVLRLGADTPTTEARLARMRGPLAMSGASLIGIAAPKKGAAAARDSMLSATLLEPVRPWRVLEAIRKQRGKLEPKGTDGGQSDAPAESQAPLDLYVLVAEDNVVNQKVAAGKLAKLGCRVDLASDGRQAVEMVAAREYDVVLMDCQMPEVDGFEATRRIRAAKARPGLPILAMTADAMTGAAEKCRAAGMDDYIAKPVKTEDLRRALERWTPRARAARLSDVL
jgi:CheY-like chemotaxis protein